MPKILHLTLTKQWFDLTAAGKKPYEYREYKPYWFPRLKYDTFSDCAYDPFSDCAYDEFDEIRYTNGYGNHRPFCRVVFDGLWVCTGDISSDNKLYPCNGEILDPNKIYFAIGNGEVLEVGNV